MKKQLLTIVSILLLNLSGAWAADPTRGRLICPNGAPLANCPVRVEWRDSTGTVASADTHTDAAGVFSVTLLCTNSSGVGEHFHITTRCCGHPWNIPSTKCSGDLGVLVCQECNPEPPCLPPPANMVDWWTFDEPLGPGVAVANDIAGAVNNRGFHVNGPTPIAAGKVRGALCFDGQDDWVQVRNHAEVNFFGSCAGTVGTEDFSIDAWVRIDDNSFDARLPIVDKRVNPQSPAGYFLYIANGRLAFQMSDGVSVGNYVEPGPSITPGAWHLVAVTVDRCDGVGTLYVDGVPVLVFNPLGGNIANDSDLFIGRLSPPFGDVFLRGCLDELEFFKRALKPEEIAALYEADSRGKCRPCVVLRCPEDMRVFTCAEETPVEYEPTVINLCNSNITVNCHPPSGSSFPVGTHTVICEAKDPAGNVIDRCTFTVSVARDITPPEIHCPSNQVYWVCSPNGGIVNYNVTATDDYDTNVTIICVPPSGSFFPPGVHTVQCQAFDDCQNSSRCEFTVTVRVDTEPPQIECPDDIRRVICDSNAVVHYTVTATDNSGSVSVVCNPPSGSTFPLGTTTVICRAIDRCDREARCEFKVTVERDTTPPEIHCPSNQVYWVCSPNGGMVNYTVTATDDYDTNVTIICVPPSGSIFTPGVHVVHCQAIDDCQNISRCEFTVTVRVDTEPPKIECPDDIRRVICESNAVVHYTVTATDNSGSVSVVCVPPSGSTFPLGTTTVICRAIDRCDLEARCEFKVTLVRDTTPPEIHCPSNQVYWVCSPNGGIINYTVTATDDYDPNPTIICVPPSGSPFPPGVHVVHCQAIDDCQNTSRCEFTVTVRVDTEPPKIECPDDIRKFVCDSNAVVHYTVTATDNSGSVSVTCNPPSGSVFPLGTTTVVCRAIDRCDLEVRCEFRVTIMRDVEPPQLVCPTNITVVTTCTNVAQVHYTVTATDNADTNVTITCLPPSGSVFPAGVTIVNCVAVDDCGNRSECSFRVRVRPVPAPRLSIYRLPGGQIAVCWPATAPGFQLQTAGTLNPPVPWVDVPGAPVIMSGEYCVIFDANERHRFNRLRCAGVVRVDDE